MVVWEDVDRGQLTSSTVQCALCSDSCPSWSALHFSHDAPCPPLISVYYFTVKEKSNIYHLWYNDSSRTKKWPGKNKTFKSNCKTLEVYCPTQHFPHSKSVPCSLLCLSTLCVDTVLPGGSAVPVLFKIENQYKLMFFRFFFASTVCIQLLLSKRLQKTITYCHVYCNENVIIRNKSQEPVTRFMRELTQFLHIRIAMSAIM